MLKIWEAHNQPCLTFEEFEIKYEDIRSRQPESQISIWGKQREIVQVPSYMLRFEKNSPVLPTTTTNSLQTPVATKNTKMTHELKTLYGLWKNHDIAWSRSLTLINA